MNDLSPMRCARRYGILPFLAIPLLVAAGLLVTVELTSNDHELERLQLDAITVWCHPEVKDGGQRMRVHVASHGALWSIGRVRDCEALRRADKAGTELVFHRTHGSIYSLSIGGREWVSEAGVRSTQRAAAIMVSLILFGMFLGWYAVLRNRIAAEAG